LSRACLGKKVMFNIQMIQKRRFFAPNQSTPSSTQPAWRP
jgi:hypothetical protein